MKNGIIINGVAYALKQALYGPSMQNVCDNCDLWNKCFDMQGNICEPFEKSGYVPYFKKEKESTNN